MKKVKVLVRDRNVLVLEEDALKGDIIDLREVSEFDYSYLEKVIEEGRSSLFESKIKEERENLALWKMYAGYDGIRIGLDENMFVSFPNSPFNTFRSFYSKIAYFGNGYCADQYTNKIKIYDVQYSDDLKGIVSNLVHLDNGKLSINTSDAGLIKRTEWYMQKESRFKIQVLPLNYSYIPYKAEQLNNMDRLQLTEANIKVVPALIQSIKEDYDPSVPYIFMPLRTEAINSMEIMMGPCTNKADRIIVESLLKDLRNSKIYNSKFKDVIRK